MGRQWEKFASELDERFSAIRLTEGRQVTKKPFSNMAVKKTSPSKSYAEAGQWLAES